MIISSVRNVSQILSPNRLEFETISKLWKWIQFTQCLSHADCTFCVCVHVCVCGFFLLTVASFVKQTERKTAYNACTTCEWIGGKRRSEERGTKEWSAAVIHTVDCDVCWSTLTVAYTTNREKKIRDLFGWLLFSALFGWWFECG